MIVNSGTMERGRGIATDFTLPSSTAATTSTGAHARARRDRPMRSKRNPPSAGPPSSPAPHAKLYNPYETPNDPMPASDVASPMYASDGVMTRPPATACSTKNGMADV